MFRVLNQLQALLFRAGLLKWRQKKQTIIEILLPFLFVVISTMIKYALEGATGSNKLKAVEDIEPWQITFGSACFNQAFISEVGFEACFRQTTDAITEQMRQRIPNDQRISNLSGFFTENKELYSSQKIGFAPTAYAKSFLNKTKIKHLFFEGGIIFGNNRDDLEKKYKTKEIQIGVVFDSAIDPSQNEFNCPKINWTYAILINPIIIPPTGEIEGQKDQCYKAASDTTPPQIQSADDCLIFLYQATSIVYLQSVIDYSYSKVCAIQSSMPFNMPDIKIKLNDKPSKQPFPRQAHHVFIALCIVMSQSPFINFLLVNIVTEKEFKIRDGLRMMGMYDWIYGLSWFIVYTIELIIASLIACAACMFPVYGLFVDSDFTLITITYFLYGETILLMALAIAPMFDKASIAGMSGSFICIVFALLYLFTMINPTGVEVYSLRRGLAVLSPTAMAQCVELALAWQQTGEGVHWKNMAMQIPDLDSQITYWDIFMVLIFDIGIYTFLAIYIDTVSNVRMRFPDCLVFFIFPSYWVSHKMTEKELDRLKNQPGMYIKPAQDIEVVSAELRGKEVVKVVALRKEFKDGETVAVEGLTLEMYEGQITCLLGHNGAGKTTTINMMTGVLPITSGTVLVYGYDITYRSDLDKFRQMMGVCPQFDILYDFMTPFEHLQMVAMIKGAQKNINEEVKILLHDVDLMNFADIQVKNLSTGQKRKLSVAIALICDPKVVFLDEPSSGMDPAARRKLWNFLQRRKAGKVILLTTHFMDEADILADRKAIMSHGHLRCMGSSLFLKNRFGIGYHLNMTLLDTTFLSLIVSTVRSCIPSAQTVRSHGKELSFILPIKEIPYFAQLFEELEKPLRLQHSSSGDVTSELEELTTFAGSLGILRYGVSMTTLEEVFLKLSEEGNENMLHQTGMNAAGIVVADKPPSRKESLEKADELMQSIEKDGLSLQGKMGPSMIDYPGMMKAIRANDTVSSVRLKFWSTFSIWFFVAVRNVFSIIFRAVVPIFLLSCGFALLRVRVDLDQNAPAKTYEQLYKDRDEPFKLHVKCNGTMFNLADFKKALKLVHEEVELIDASAMNAKELKYETWLECTGTSNVSNDFVFHFNDSEQHAPPFLTHLIGVYNYHTAQKPLSNRKFLKSGMGGFVGRPNLKLSIELIFSTIMIGLAMTAPGPSFGAEIVRYRQNQISALLRLSNVGFGVFWHSLFLAHLLQSLLVVLFLPIIILIFGIETLMSPGALIVIAALTLSYMPQNILLNYVFSFAFTRYDTCITAMPTLIMMAGFIPYMMPSILYLNDFDSDFADVMHKALCVLDPLYIIYGGIFQISRVYIRASIKQEPIEASSYWLDKNISFGIIMNIVYTGVFYMLLRIIYTKHMGRPLREAIGLHGNAKNKKMNTDFAVSEDVDVKRMRKTVEDESYLKYKEGGDDPYPMCVLDSVRKEYRLSPTQRIMSACSAFCCMHLKKPKHINAQQPGTSMRSVSGGPTQSNVTASPSSPPNRTTDVSFKDLMAQQKNILAVRNICLQVYSGEVFGLLGPSSAGKTTVLKMITAEVIPDCGKVLVDMQDVQKPNLKQLVGYCPEHDALWDDITLKEHLEYYGLITGMNKKTRLTAVNFFLDALRIREHTNKKVKQLSGGTKRKLSFAIAMIGSSRLVLLDEPSTGMDPQSKRFLWDAIIWAFRGEQRKGAILTTHSMEEADALCDRVGIMVKGQLRCLGTTQHLKEHYGQGYYLELKENRDSTPPVDQSDNVLHQFVEKEFPGAKIVESVGDATVFHISGSSMPSLAAAFKTLERAKNDLNLIQEYSLSQTSLEQVFLTFAKEQEITQQRHELRREPSTNQVPLSTYVVKSSEDSIKVNNPNQSKREIVQPKFADPILREQKENENNFSLTFDESSQQKDATIDQKIKRESSMQASTIEKQQTATKSSQDTIKKAA